jgi:hypothetical protein
LLKQAKSRIKRGNVAYINAELKYYGICAEPEKLSDWKWAETYAILEDIRQREKEEAKDEFGNGISD